MASDPRDGAVKTEGDSVGPGLVIQAASELWSVCPSSHRPGLTSRLWPFPLGLWAGERPLLCVPLARTP